MKNATREKYVNFTLNDQNTFKYFGACSAERNMIEFEFLNDWNLKFYFYKVNNKSFVFNHVVLYYKFAGPLYPYSTHKGAQSEIYDTVFINSSLHHSYTCQSGIRMDLGNVILYLENLKVQPFFNKRANALFDAELVCAGDHPPPDPSSSYSIWLIILVVSIILICLILFIVFRVMSDDSRNKKEYNNL
jgi:hypothetical protein